MQRLDGKVAIVTGGSGNLGGAIAHALEKTGVSLVLPDRHAEGIRDHFPELNADEHLFPAGYNALDGESNQAVAQAALDRFGRIDILINTVGGYRAGTPVHETTVDTWDFMLNLNAKSAFLLSQAVLPTMIAQQHGVMIHTAAKSALKAGANEAAYAASKAALARLVEGMHAEYKGSGIIVNAILPGIMDTPTNREANPDADFSLWVQPAHIAECVVFLSTDAGRVISGSLIPLSGRQ